MGIRHEGGRGAATALALTLLTLPLGCAGAPGPDAAAAPAEVAGCYRLAVGPWLHRDGSPLHEPRRDAPPFDFPDVVLLLAEESRVPVFGHRALRPQPPEGSLFPFASWHGGPSRLVLEWSGPTAFSPGLDADLQPVRGGGFAGQVRYRSDVVTTRFFRDVRAHPVPCPLDLEPGRR